MRGSPLIIYVMLLSAVSQYKIFLLVQNAAIVTAAATEGGHSAGSSCFPFLLSLTLPHVFFVGLKVGEV